MSVRDVVVLVAAALAVVLATVWSVRSQHTGANRHATQLVAGLVCGAAAAISAAVPFVDVVPDAEEGAVAAAVAVLLALLAAGAVATMGGRARRGRRSGAEELT